MNLDHLPRQSGAKVAGVSVHYADQTGHVVRQLRPTAVAIVIDEREIVFETDASTDRHRGGHQRCEAPIARVLIGIVGNEKRAPVEEHAARQTAPAYNAGGIRAMPVLRPRLSEMFASFFHVAERGVWPRMRRARFESANTLLSVSRSGLVERFANAIEISPVSRRKRIEIEQLHVV